MTLEHPQGINASNWPSTTASVEALPMPSAVTGEVVQANDCGPFLFTERHRNSFIAQKDGQPLRGAGLRVVQGGAQ